MDHTSTKLIPTEEERRALFRALWAWTGSEAVAEDLVQQTLLEAWNSKNQPESAQWRPWLFGIARNILLRWRRALAADLRRTITAPQSEAVLETASVDIDIDSELERQEIVQLLQEILDLLPSETRKILLLKYIQELPQRAIAEELRLHEKAVEGRLHRAKKSLRQQLLAFRPDSAVQLGIVTEPNTWQQTNYWCRTCGNQRLLARWSDEGALWFDCPACKNGERVQHYVGGLFQSKNPNRRPTFGRVVNYFQTQIERCLEAGREQTIRCPNPVCSGILSYRSDEIMNSSGGELIVPAVFRCDSCNAQLVFEDLCDGGIDTFAGRAFTDRHPRVMTLPRTKTVHHGIQSLQTHWIAIGGAAEFVTWHDARTGRLVDTYTSDG